MNTPASQGRSGAVLNSYMQRVGKMGKSSERKKEVGGLAGPQLLQRRAARGGKMCSE